MAEEKKILGFFFRMNFGWISLIFIVGVGFNIRHSGSRSSWPEQEQLGVEKPRKLFFKGGGHNTYYSPGNLNSV